MRAQLGRLHSVLGRRLVGAGDADAGSADAGTGMDEEAAALRIQAMQRGNAARASAQARHAAASAVQARQRGA